jgi:hypothetical protein
MGERCKNHSLFSNLGLFPYKKSRILDFFCEARCRKLMNDDDRLVYYLLDNGI